MNFVVIPEVAFRPSPFWQAPGSVVSPIGLRREHKVSRFLLCIVLCAATACNFDPSGAPSGDPDARSADTMPVDAPVDGLVATGCTLAVPAGDNDGFRAGFPRPIEWSATSAKRIVVRASPATTSGLEDGQVLYDRDANTGSLTGVQDVIFPPDLTNLSIDCEGDVGTPTMTAPLPVRAILLNITECAPGNKVKVGQPGFDFSWSAPGLSGNVCTWRGLQLEDAPSYPAAGLVHRVWDTLGPVTAEINCGLAPPEGYHHIAHLMVVSGSMCI